jgi:hypothetical protein
MNHHLEQIKNKRASPTKLGAADMLETREALPPAAF